MNNSKKKKFYPIAEPDIGPLERKYVLDAVRSGWVSSLGRYVIEFERRFAEFCETREAVSTCNGTAALHLALASLGIGPGDEVVVPALTFVASASAVVYTGARPVFADVDESTWCVSAETIARALSPRTRAIIVVHLFGQPADMDPILALGARRRIRVIEDAAEAHGALYRGRKVGGIGDVGVFSFYGNKIVTTGEGGMLVTGDRTLAERARFLRDHAMSPSRRYYHPEIGYNYRLTNLQAALGLAQLERVDEFIARRVEVMRWYREELRDRPDLILNPDLPWARSADWMVSMVFPKDFRPDEIAERLREKGVDSRPFFHPLHLLPSFASRRGKPPLSLPVAEELARRGLSLPSAGKLRRGDIAYICRSIREVVNSAAGQKARARTNQRRRARASV